MSLPATRSDRTVRGDGLRQISKGKRRGTVRRFWTALAIAAVVGVALFLLAAADAGASRSLGAIFF
jgi:hypothetical protein